MKTKRDKADRNEDKMKDKSICADRKTKGEVADRKKDQMKDKRRKNIWRTVGETDKKIKTASMRTEKRTERKTRLIEDENKG